MKRADWEELGQQPKPSWYLDDLVARQKREVHLDLIRRWWDRPGTGRVLKTDLFEEAFGQDRILDEILPLAEFACAIDASFSTTRAAALRGARGHVFVSDVRQLALKTEAFDLVISTSTLDHFPGSFDFRISIEEIHRMLRPGGLLILTLDNPSNPLYAPLRLLSHTRFAPYQLGYSPSLPELKCILRDSGFEVEQVDWLLHNPRLVSSALFLLLRRLLGPKADGPISLLLRSFALLGKLPTRRWTSCFEAVLARRVGTLPEHRPSVPEPAAGAAIHPES